MSKQRHLGGLLGANPVRSITTPDILSAGTWGATDSAFTLTADPYHLTALHPGGWQARKYDLTMSSGKYYAEIYITPGHSNMYCGLVSSSFADGAGWVGDSTDGMGLYAQGGAVYSQGAGNDTVTGSSYNSGSNVLQIAVDVDSREAWWGVNNTWHNASADPSTGTSGIALRNDLTTGDLQFAISSINNTSSFHFNDGSNGTFDGNLAAGGNTDANGNGDFYYAVPTGFQGAYTVTPGTSAAYTDTTQLDTYDFGNTTVQLGANGGAGDYVGYSNVSISKDGNTAVASSIFDNGGAGHVLVFEKSGGTWSQVAALTSPESASEVAFGYDNDISDDGTVIIVSDNQSKKNSSTTTGINCGNVYVYEKGAGWADGTASHTQTFIVADNSHNSVNYLGDAITISGDGNTIAAGNRLGTSNRAYATSNLGSVYLWEKDGSWAATANTPLMLISTSQTTNGKFGCDEKHALSLSEDGQTLVVRHKGRTTEGRVEILEAGSGGWTAPSLSSTTSAHHVSILDGTGSGNGHGERVAVSNDGLTIAAEVATANTIIVHEKGAGWPSVGMTSQVATLSNSASNAINLNGMSKDGKHVTAYDTGSYELLVWARPATGWADADETYRIAADATSTSTFNFGQWAAISDVGDLIISDDRHSTNLGRVEFHSANNAVSINRTIANVGILSLDEAGPEAVTATSSTPDTLDLTNTVGTETSPYEVDGIDSALDGAYFASTGITSGKHYWEVDYAVWGDGTGADFYSIGLGVYRGATTPTAGGNWVNNSGYYGSYLQNQNFTTTLINGSLGSNSNTAPFPSLTGGTFGVLLDADNHTITVYVDGVVTNDVNGMSTGGSGTETYYPWFGSGGGQDWTHEVNFGQRPFNQTVPAGASAGWLLTSSETRELTPFNWGGIRGRDSVLGTDPDFHLANTGILSLSELLQASYGGAAAAVPWDGTANVLIVAGGGGGASRLGVGGGGAGALLEGTMTLTSATTYQVQVGAGGKGGSPTSTVSGAAGQYQGVPGADSKFYESGSAANEIPHAIGGAAGSIGAGNDGGSGSGGGRGTGGSTGGSATNTGGNEPAGFTYYGNDGGGGANSLDYGGAGGGGAGSAGENGSTSSATGVGGAGLEISWITATAAGSSALNVGEVISNSVYFAGGGGGSSAGAAGGSGGGGDGAVSQNAHGSNAISHTGSGGGGGGTDLSYWGGAGGTGVVVVKLVGLANYSLDNDFTDTGGLTATVYSDGTDSWVAFKCTTATSGSGSSNTGGTTGTGTWTPTF